MKHLTVVFLFHAVIGFAAAYGDAWGDVSGLKWHYRIDAGGVVLGRCFPKMIPNTDIPVDDYIKAVVCTASGDNPLKFNFTCFDGVGQPVLKVPSSIAGLPVRKVDKAAFCCLSGTKKIILPECLEFIGFGAFAGSSLEEIEIPGGVSRIEECLFNNCTNLWRVRLPSCIRMVPCCFNNCPMLSKVEIPNGVQQLKGRFRGCPSLGSIKLPRTLEEIADDVFDECSSLEAIDVAEGSERLFSVDGILCSKISREILCVPWRNRTRVLKIPDGASFQGVHGKCGNRAVEKIVIPKSMKSVATTWLKSFPNVRSVEVDFGNESYKVEDNILYDAKFKNVLYSPQNSNASGVRLPHGVVNICDYAFGACRNLEEIDLPCGVEKIGRYAFARTRLKQVKMPKTVSKIEPMAFDRCYELSCVEFDCAVLFVHDEGVVRVGFESSKKGDAVCEVDSSSFSDCSETIQFKVYDKVYSLQDMSMGTR